MSLHVGRVGEGLRNGIVAGLHPKGGTGRCAAPRGSRRATRHGVRSLPTRRPSRSADTGNSGRQTRKTSGDSPRWRRADPGDRGHQRDLTVGASGGGFRLYPWRRRRRKARAPSRFAAARTGASRFPCARSERCRSGVATVVGRTSSAKGAQAPLGPVAGHGIANLAAGRESEANARAGGIALVKVPTHLHDHARLCRSSPRCRDGKKFRPPRQSAKGRRSRVPFGIDGHAHLVSAGRWRRRRSPNGQALRRLRPLARRLARMRRPAAVAMRARKPCRRLRTILLGWNGRFTGRVLNRMWPIGQGRAEAPDRRADHHQYKMIGRARCAPQAGLYRRGARRCQRKRYSGGYAVSHLKVAAGVQGPLTVGLPGRPLSRTAHSMVSSNSRY